MARIRPRTKQFLIAGGIGAIGVLLICVPIFYFGYDYMSREQTAMKLKYQHELDEARELIEQYEASHSEVWLLGNDIEAGHVMEATDFVAVQMLTELIPDNAMDKRDAIGKVTKIPLRNQTLIVDTMLFEEGEISPDLRSHEYSLIRLPMMLQPKDFVDIRIGFPGGQDYIVLSKKRVEYLHEGTIWHQLNEEEIMRMSSAVVDAYLNNAYIYAITYVDPYMQREAIVNYPANEVVRKLMERDPNIIGMATRELEKRERQLLEEQLDAMSSLDIDKYKNNGQIHSTIEPPNGISEDNTVYTPPINNIEGEKTGTDSQYNNTATDNNKPRQDDASNSEESQGAFPNINDQQDIFLEQPPGD